MRIGSLFSGAGGLDLAVEEVFSGETIWHSEIDKAASKVLAYRWPGVPNLGSITEIDWASVEPVDVLCGGFPCQDVSAAGKRAGIKDGSRSGLWAVFAEAIDALRPRYVVIENVRGLLSAAAHRTVEDDAGDYLEPDPSAMGDAAGRPVLRAAGAVLGDLADLGYDSVWATVAAADVGAPHRRERVFIIAEAADAEGTRRSVRHTAHIGQADRKVNAFADDCGTAADAKGDGWDEGRPESAGIVGGFDAAVSGDEPGGAFIVADSSSAAVWESARSASAEETRSQSGDRPGDCGGERTPRDGRQACVCGCRRIDHDWGAHPDRFDDGGCRRCRCESFWPSADEPGVALLPTPNAQDGNGGGRYSSAGHQSTLPGEVRLLPTPTQSDGTGGGIRTGLSWEGTTKSTGDGGNSRLRDVVGLLLPTPRSSDCFGAGQHGDGGMDLRTTISLLPTPTATDGSGGGVHADSDMDELAGPNCARSKGDKLRDLVKPMTAWGKYEPAIRRWEQIVGPAPAPTEPNKNGNPRLSAAFSEWLMGWPAGWVTDPAIGISRNDQLRIVGNGVCVQQAAAALTFLLGVATGTHTHTAGAC